MNKELNQHCSYCNKTIKYQSNWIKHQKTKRHLKNVEKMNQNEHNVSQNRTQIEHKQNTIEHNCEYCNKTFKTRPSMLRHIKKYCGNKKIEEEKDKLILEQQTIIKELRKQIETLRNENKELKVVNNITNNTIVINNVGEEDTKGIMNQLLFENIAIACNGDNYNNIEANHNKAIELVLDEVYNKQENRNVKYTNLQSNNCKIFKNNKWITTDIDECIIDRIKECPEKLESMLEDFMNETGIIQQVDIDVIIEKLENKISDNDILKLKKVFKNIIKKQRRLCYDITN